MLVGLGCSFATPLLSARLLDMMGGEGAKDTCANPAGCGASIGDTAVLIGLIKVAQLAAGAGERRFGEMRSERVKAQLQKRCFEAIMRQDDRYLDGSKVGVLLTTLQETGASWLVSGREKGAKFQRLRSRPFPTRFG